MSEIAQNVKQVALQLFSELQQKGDDNIVDINLFTRTVQSSIIVSQLIGNECCFNSKIPYQNLTTGEHSVKTIAAHFEVLLEDIMMRITKNPLAGMHSYFAEKALFSIDTRYFANCHAIRAYLLDIVE